MIFNCTEAQILLLFTQSAGHQLRRKVGFMNGEWEGRRGKGDL